MINSTNFTFKLIKWASFSVFLGRAYQHLFWDAPFRSFFWDQNLLEPIVVLFYPNWNSYATDLNTDNFIQLLIKCTGILYLICAFLSLFIKKNSKRILTYSITLGSILLVFLSLLITKEKFYSLAMFFEHSLQFTTPLLLQLYIHNKNEKWFNFTLKTAIALTFICHGIYATGIIYPIPANFTSMTMIILNLTESTSKSFLYIMGVIDFLIGILIFLPKLSNITLVYAAFWGLLTALARLLYGSFFEVSFITLHQYAYLTIYRLPHALIPLATFYLNRRTNKNVYIYSK